MKLLTLDGNSILNRAFYGIKLLTTKEGMFTNGIVGFMNILLKLTEETAPDAVAIAFDMRAPTFRHKMYAGYKAQRKGMPPELAAQMPVLKELLTALGYRIVTCEGWEADDILGTFAAACEAAGDSCVIATGDRDSLQLVSDSTTVRLATTKFGQSVTTHCDTAWVEETYGVLPKQLIDWKAIQGDASDNIPGVAGIGEKGAGDLIRNFGSLSYIYDNLDTLDIKPGQKDKLQKSRENAFLSLELGTIRTDAPIETEAALYVRGAGDPAAAAALMTQLELFKLMERMQMAPGAAPSAVQAEAAQALPVRRYADGAALLTQCKDAGEAYFLAEYAGGKIEKLRFCGVFSGKQPEVAEVSVTDSFLKAFLGSPSIKKYTADVKPLHRAALRLGTTLQAAQLDVSLAAYLLNPAGSDYTVARLAAEYGVPLGVYEEGEEGAASAAALPGVCKALMKAIDENNQRELLETIEMPLALVLGEMEEIGVQVDSDGIRQYGEALVEELTTLQKEIFEDVGYEFNLQSPAQLGEALFVKLGLPHGKKTKTGYSTNADVLEGLRDVHPAVEKILRFRTLSKLKSTYCDGLLKVVDENGRIHSSFNQTETRTGRISSTEPNLQNIPVRTALGRELRRFFVAPAGRMLVDADYSQIELRVLAHVANDKQMIEDFSAGRDIHTSTAARVFDMPEILVTPQMRSRAKAVNFGIVYGIGAFSLAKDIGVSRREAEDYIHDYLKNFKGVADYMERVVEEAKQNGFVETLFGRRRYLPELSSSNFNMRAFGERVARNMPIQGAAADIIKIAMIRVSHRLKNENLEARLILQVHDELIVECPKAECDRVKKLLAEEMEHAVELSVPMTADAAAGESWYAAKG